MRIREIMSRPAVVVLPDLAVKEAAAILVASGFTCLPVVDGDGRFVGVVGEAELLADRFPPNPAYRSSSGFRPLPAPPSAT